MDDATKKAFALAAQLEAPTPLDPFVPLVDRFEQEMREEAASRILSGETDGYSVCIEDVPHDVADHIGDALVAAATAVAQGVLPRSWDYSINLDRGRHEVRVQVDP